MDMQTANRNLFDALHKQLDGLGKGSLFAVVRFVGQDCPNTLLNGIAPREWHVVEVGEVAGRMLFPRASHDDTFNAGYEIGPWLEIMGINMMGDVNMPHTWAASGLSMSHEQRVANWFVAKSHAIAVNNGAPQISGWEGAAKLGEAIQQKQAATQHVPSNTAQSLADEILAREAVGTEKYGTTVDGNPLPAYAWHQHGVEEALDLAMYLRRSQADAQVATAAVDSLFVLMDASGEELRDYLVQCNTPDDGERLRLALLTLRALFPSGA